MKSTLLALIALFACMNTAAIAEVVVAGPLPAGPASGTASNAQVIEPEDAYRWLEEVTGDKPLAWVRERNAETAKELEAGDAFQKLKTEILATLDSDAKIPELEKAGAFYYNHWRDAKHPRGLFRRTTLEEYRKENPAWELVLDLDALGAAEKESWVFHGALYLKPDCTRCLLSLSRGGADAAVIREFDLTTKTFVKDGFQLPEAKSDVSWIDRDTIFVGTDFGPESMTDSGYPRIIKRWKRGTPLASATLVYEGKRADMAVSALHDPTREFERDFILRRTTFFSGETFLLNQAGSVAKIEVPDDAEVDVHREWLLIKLRTEWTVDGKKFPAGSLLATGFDAFLAGKREIIPVFTPTATTSLQSHAWTRHFLVLNVLDDVKNRLHVLTPQTGEWLREPLPGAPGMGTVAVSPVDPEESDAYFMKIADYLTPDTYCHGTVGSAPERLKSNPEFFDASGLEMSQQFARSKDGTRIPYFQVSPKGMALDGSHPTLLTGYGGFEIALMPKYSGTIGRGWLSQGFVYVVANIRGGGEYGPAWHQAALKRNRHRAYEDFAAVAEDLVARKVTVPARLGIQGGSNGGLLVGNMLTGYPQLIGAVVCQIPLLDMKRYSQLLAGASWMAEYGDPDKPEEWEFIKTFSPYHLVEKGRKYPPVLFMTTTRDDRVHPGHARKMTARMRDMGYDVRLFENIEGGHGAGADNQQTAHFWALGFTFLKEKLK